MTIKYLNKKYIRASVLRYLQMPESPEKISLAVAIGLFVGFAIPVGGQIPFVVLLCILFNAKKLIPLGILFTCITNPWTAPILYPMFAYLGSLLMGKPLSFKYIEKALKHLLRDFNAEAFFALGWDILLPFIVGSIFLAFLFGIVGYFCSYGVIVSYRARREKKLARRLSVSVEDSSSSER